MARLLFMAAMLIVPAARAQQAPADSLAAAAPRLAKLVPPLPTPSFVSDARGVLTADEHVRIDARIRAHQDAGLGDIAVAILPSVGDYAPSDVALAIHRTWRVGTIAEIGSARRDLGVLVLIVPKELAPDHRGQCFISTGPGTQGIITDATAGSICRDVIIPQLRQRAYASAVSAGIEDISARLTADSSIARATTAAAPPPSQPASPTPRESFNPWPVLVAALLALLAIVAGVVRWRSRYGPHACPKCGKPMRRLAEADDDAHLAPGARKEEALGSVDHDVWACECGEHLSIPYPKWFAGFIECDACHVRAVRSTRRIAYAPTLVSTGLAITTHVCESCTRTTVTEQVLPQRPPPPVPTASGGGGGGGSGGSGGGGDSGGGSFGGSGRNDGGGGGASY